ncbi:coatomer protein [Trametes polyzona]|nr:coatomer protein [Trametes polyzona]
MNLSLYTVTAFLIIDTDGHRVLAKYYHPKGHPNGESKKLTTLKEQRAFEKGLFQKTKKAGGMYPFAYCTQCICAHQDNLNPPRSRAVAYAYYSVFWWCANIGDIILYDSHLAVYKHSLDLIFYIIGDPSENELMLHSALVAFSDAVHMLLRNQVEKRGVLENLDLVLLCLDETIDDGVIVETDSTTIASRVSRPKADTTDIVINEQTLLSAYQTVKEKMQQRIGQL